MANEDSSVRVAVRIRPQTPGEVVEGCGVCAAAGGAAGDGAITLGSDRAFTFDYAFDPEAGQDQVYDSCVRKLVDDALDGYNATVLAYGQTGSGKTYTMGSGWEGEGEEDEDRRGIIPRAIRDLFAGTEARAEAAREQGQLPPEFSVHAQFIELYNEDIVDLLDPARDPYGKGTLRITEDGCGGVRIVGASLRPVRGAREALGCLRAGALARTTAATNMNSSSSRSHAVFTLMLRQRRLAVDQDGVDKEENGEGPEQFEILTAKFHFVDLAGSERLKRTGATGDRAREGISINCGLLALGNVISALGDKSRKVSHVPYRDSKLTRLLQDSLGGNSNTVMIACVSPSDRDFMETLNTLKYANRARNIKNRCVLNQDLTSRTIHQLRQQIARLQLELTEYKQGKRVVAENGEEGWSDVVQENAILTGEVEALRRRVKAMQGTIEQLSTKNSELLAEKALGAWVPKDGSPDASECSLTTLVQGYVREIEELRAQLLEANAMYEASRKREVASRARLDSSVNDTASVIVDAKRELYKEKEILARSMGELEFHRKLNMSESMTSTVGDSEIGERERAEGESAESDSEGEGDAAQEALTEELATLSSEIDTKQRLIEELEVSQRRLAALRSHYETRLDTLHHQIKATQHERDKVLASYAQQSSPPTDKLKRIREDYERRLSAMSRELKRLQSAQKEHSKLQRTQQQTASQISTLNSELRDMKREKVKLVQRMRVEAKRHAAAEALRAKEVAQLRKESRKNANLIRSLEAERRIKEQVLRRKQEEVSLLRKGHRDKLSSRAAGRLHDRPSKRNNLREVWTRVDRWLTRAIAAKSMLGELEASLERALTERERVRKELSTSPDPEAVTDHLRYLNQSIAETQQQIMQLEEENEENEFGSVVSALECECVCREVLQRVCVSALAQGYEGARSAALLRDTRAQLRQLEESTERTASAFRAAEGQNMNLNVWEGVSGTALAELLARVSSGSNTRPVSPTNISPVWESRPPALARGPREPSATAPVSPSHTPTDNGPFQRNSGRRGSVRLRDLGVYSRDSSPPAAMTQSLMEPLPQTPPHVPLTRVPSAPGTLRGLTPIGNAITSVLMSPITLRRPPPESPRLPRRQNSLAKPSLESNEGTPPASPGMARRNRDDDVFLRLTGTQAGENGPPRGTVKEYPIKRVSNNVGGAVRLHCTHVAEGHAGAALALANTHTQLYSGGVDRTVRGWDVSGGGAERWRGWCGGVVTSLLAAPPALLLAAAGAALRIFDTRHNHHQHTLWSSGASGNNPPARGAAGEVAITAIAVASDDVTVYTAVADKLRIWDLRMMECLGKVWSGHAAAVMCLGVRRSLGGHLAVTGSKDHYVRMMELQRHQTGGLEATSRRLLEPPHYDGVQALTLTSDYLYSASRDTSLKRWHMPSGTMTHGIMNAHKGWVTGVASVGEGPNELIASCGRDGAVKLWDTELKAVARPASLPDAAHCLVSHPDPNNMAIYTAGNDGKIRLWKIRRAR